MPRDDQDTDRQTGLGDDRPFSQDADESVRDRPGGPAAEGGQVSGAGEISPGAAEDEDVPEDDVIEQRRQHVVANHGPDGTESGNGSAGSGSAGTGQDGRR